MNSNEGLKIAAKRGVKLRQGSRFIFKGREAGWSLQGGLKIHTRLTAMGHVKLDWLPARWPGSLVQPQPCLEAACQAPRMCSGVTGNASGSARQGGRAAGRDSLSSAQVCYFPLNSHQLSNQEHESPGDLTFSSSPVGKQNFK